MIGLKLKPLPLLPTPVPGRICWGCIYSYFSNTGRGYSELTPGYEAEIHCQQMYWEVDLYNDTLEDFRNKLMSAELCSDFKAR